MNTMITATVSLNTEALTLNSTLDIENYQGNAVINYTDAETPTPALLSINTLKAVKVKKQL